MKKWIAIVLALLLVLGGIYAGSPYYALYSLRDAARKGDVAKLEARVDFPSVRESLKPQASAAMRATLGKAPDLRDNALAAVGALILPAIADRAVDALVTPEAIAALMRGHRPSEKADGNSDVQADTRYLDHDHMQVTFRNSRRGDTGPSFLLERRGFASWKLTSIDLDPKA